MSNIARAAARPAPRDARRATRAARAAPRGGGGGGEPRASWSPRASSRARPSPFSARARGRGRGSSADAVSVDARVAARTRRDEDEDGRGRVVGARRRAGAGTSAVALERRADAARRMRRRRIRVAPSAGSRDDDDAGWDEGPIGGDEDDARWGGAPTKSREDDGDDWFGSMTSMDVDAYGDVMMGGKRSSGSTASSAADDIIDGANDWFNNNDDWFEPQYKEVNAPPGTMLEKVQRMTLNEPSDFSFKDGEYFDLMGYVKHKTDNEFCLVLEVAERARERKLERSESLSGTGPRLPPIQQAIADLALEIELSGGKTSAYLAMREAADRARLRYELQQASWCWDKYSEDSMRALGVSEKAEQMLHQGERIDEAMDFERELMIEDMNDSGTRRF